MEQRVFTSVPHVPHAGPDVELIDVTFVGGESYEALVRRHRIVVDRPPEHRSALRAVINGCAVPDMLASDPAITFDIA